MPAIYRLSVCLALSMTFFGPTVFAKRHKAHIKPVVENADGDTGGAGPGGGAGVNLGGVRMTFYTAGLYVEPSPYPNMPPEPVPEVEELRSYLLSLPYLGQGTKARYSEAILATTTRQYYRANPASLTPSVLARLKGEFQRTTGVDPREIELFALTDTQQRNTYILPNFFSELSHSGRLAALFHENYWIVNPNATYSQVVHAEEAFQAAYEQPKNIARIFDFVQSVGTADEINHLKVAVDYQFGSLYGLYGADNRIPLKALFGAAYFDCAKSGGGQICSQNARAYLSQVISQHPKSLILRDIATTLDEDRYGGMWYFCYVGRLIRGGFNCDANRVQKLPEMDNASIELHPALDDSPLLLRNAKSFEHETHYHNGPLNSVLGDWSPVDDSFQSDSNKVTTSFRFLY